MPMSLKDSYLFLWVVFTFICPFFYHLWKIGVAWLSIIHQFLVQHNILRARPCEIDKVVTSYKYETKDEIHLIFVYFVLKKWRNLQSSILSNRELNKIHRIVINSKTRTLFNWMHYPYDAFAKAFGIRIRIALLAAPPSTQPHQARNLHNRLLYNHVNYFGHCTKTRDTLYEV